VKHYFEFEMLCGCGIPSIELTGTVDDWRKLRQKAEVLKRFGLAWWTEELFPVLDHFVSAAAGQPDLKFWKSVCNLHGASGGWSSFVTGTRQIHTFLAFLTSSQPLASFLVQSSPPQHRPQLSTLSLPLS
jgi:hypothetical protein